MRVNNNAILSAASMQNGATSDAQSLDQAFGYSIQAVWTGAVTGSIKLQASVDNLTPSNWNDITGSSQAVSGAGSYLWNVADVYYPWVRAVYTSTATGTQTVTTVADVAKSLASAYFLIQSASGTNKYAVWFKVSGTGSAPSVTGYTNQEVDISTGATAPAVATALATVLDALTGLDAAAVGAVVTVTNTVAGPFSTAVDGATATGFTFLAVTGAGSVTANLFYRGF